MEPEHGSRRRKKKTQDKSMEPTRQGWEKKEQLNKTQFNQKTTWKMSKY